MQLNGTVIKYGDNVDTDVIIPARYLNTIDKKELASHCMEDLDTTFTSRVKPGDIMVGGENFGCGSSREHAPQTIRRSGIKAVIAESFAEIFFGNSTGIGLPCVCASAADIASLSRHISNYPETEVTIDLLNMTVSWKEGSFPIRMPAEAREALTRGRWDSIAELLVNMDAVEKKNEELPRVAASC